MDCSTKKKLPAVGSRVFGAADPLDVRLLTSPEELAAKLPASEEEAVAVLQRAYAAALPAERRARRALVGPQRDDLEVRLDGRPAASHASAGEQRRIAFLLTVAAVELAAARKRGGTIVLMDDIEAELDDERLDRVLRFLGASVQTLVATSKQGVAAAASALGRVLEVRGGAWRELQAPGARA